MCDFIFSPVLNQNEVGSLIVVVKDMSQKFTHETMGQIQIHLSLINQNQTHREWFNLYDEEANMKKSKILLEIQWIYSSVLLFIYHINKIFIVNVLRQP